MKRVVYLVIVLLVLMGGAYSFNYLSLKEPVQKGLDSDSRNNGVDIDVHYKNYIDLSVLVFNLESVPTDKAFVDVFRVLLMTSQTLKDKDFEFVELAFKGTSKFKLKGKFFKKIGEEYGVQNSIYTIRTFPMHVYSMEGKAMYSEWTGGLFGVYAKQMEDMNDFNKKWYLDN